MTTISSASASTASYYAAQKSLLSKLDTDQNGAISSNELVAGRPKGSTQAQATALFSRSDTDGSGDLSEDELDKGLKSDGIYRKPEEMMSNEAMSVLMLMSRQDSSFGSFGGESPSDLYAAMDADGDGSVTTEEFVAARPDDVSEEDATALFESIDTENTGSISEEQFAEGMRPAGGPPPGGAAPSGSNGESESSATETFDSLDTNKDGVVSSDEFLAAFPTSLSDFASADTNNLDKILELFDTGSEA